MLSFDRDAVAEALPYERLIEALDAAFAVEFGAPPRAHHTIPMADQSDATLLLMPAWQAGHGLGVKIATVFPDNARHGMPSVNASYLLLDPVRGVPRAILDGTELTLRRTAAASALASRYLSRADAATLLMVGTGKLAPHLIAAHRSVRPLTTICIWGRRPEAARAVAESLPELDVRVVDDLEAAVRAADIVSCATLSRDPLVHGEWLHAGQHVDLVGAYTPEMREADMSALQKSEVYVDTFAGAEREAGEIVQAIAVAVLGRNDIRADLRALCCGAHPGRTSAESITLFKSVGCSLEDLAAAMLVWERRETDTA